MRIRTIKPEFWTDSRIVQLPIDIRLFFVGLWQMADDWGALEDEPDRIKMTIFPADDVNPWGALDCLEESGLIHRMMDCTERRLIYIPRFCKHQKIDKRSARRFPGGKWRKRCIPHEVRSHIAKLFGCQPGGVSKADCYYCGQPATICWNAPSRPGAIGWITFGCLELDHFIPELYDGPTTKENIVLACRHCNRSKGYYTDGYSFIVDRITTGKGILVDAYPDLEHADLFCQTDKMIPRRRAKVNAESHQIPQNPAEGSNGNGMEQGTGNREQGREQGGERSKAPTPEDAKVSPSVTVSIPTWEVWWEYCRMHHGMPEWYAKDKFLAAEQANWKGKENWQAYAARCYAWWTQDGRPKAPRTPGGNGPTQLGPMGLKLKHQALQAQIDTVKARGFSDAFGLQFSNPADAQEYRQLRSQLAEVQKQEAAL